ncbi:MAG: hypothetical protein COY40_04820 [Alphaproteobacteria bacterium CG_4_10_14_0_8_um_filter_53_9]|nr:MAG: hypothetical protein COY40_04820 [Alphaproteobacteria bacterium CG_4_10_14_0_8_um_filter_53_9]
MSEIRGALRQFFWEDEGTLNVGREVFLGKDLTHRLVKVLRLKEGDRIALIDGMTGRYAAVLTDSGKRARVEEKQVDIQTEKLGPVLLLGMPKREALEAVLRQATEMGVSAIVPVRCDFSQNVRLNEERTRRMVMEAAEQCERLTLPKIEPMKTVREAVEEVDGVVLWADETAVPENGDMQGAVAFLVGPEGGFSVEESEMLRGMKNVRGISLGPRILRVDTAVVAGLSRM